MLGYALAGQPPVARAECIGEDGAAAKHCLLSSNDRGRVYRTPEVGE